MISRHILWWKKSKETIFFSKIKVFVYISASSYIYTNYIFLESTYNTDSHSKISAVGNNFEKKKLIKMYKFIARSFKQLD